MHVDVGQDGVLILKKIFNSAILQTEEGNMLAVRMRDDTIEMQVVGCGNRWHRANMETGEIYEMGKSFVGTPVSTLGIRAMVPYTPVTTPGGTGILQRDKSQVIMRLVNSLNSMNPDDCSILRRISELCTEKAHMNWNE